MTDKSIFTNNFIKDIINEIFNGNRDMVDEHTPYINENSESIILNELASGEKTEVDLAQYLNVSFYDWQNKLRTSQENGFCSPEDWLESIKDSIDMSFALVETTDQKATESADIDNGIKEGKITFLIQANKVSNLEYYVQKLRNKYLGEPFLIQNSFGKVIKAYLMIGVLFYDEEISEAQLGTTLVASCNFTLTYMDNALSYNDVKVEMSLDNGKHFYTMPLSSETWEMLAETTPVPKTNRPDLTGCYATAISSVKTLSFFDYNVELANKINEIFWSRQAVTKNNISTMRNQLDIPILLRVVCGSDVYMFNDIIDDIQKVVTNGTYNITSMTLKTSARPMRYEVTPFTAKTITLNEDNPFVPFQDKIAMVSVPKSLFENTSVMSSTLFVKSTTDCVVEFTYTISPIQTIKKVVKLKANELTPVIISMEYTYDVEDEEITLHIFAKSTETTLELLQNAEFNSGLILY